MSNKIFPQIVRIIKDQDPAEVTEALNLLEVWLEFYPPEEKVVEAPKLPLVKRHRKDTPDQVDNKILNPAKTKDLTQMTCKQITGNLGYKNDTKDKSRVYWHLRRLQDLGRITGWRKNYTLNSLTGSHE